MNLELILKIDELIEIFDNSDEIKRLLLLKKEIYEDDRLKDLILKYSNIKNNFNDEVISIKKSIIEDENIREYRLLENNLYNLVSLINRKLNSLTDEKSCNNESN